MPSPQTSLATRGALLFARYAYPPNALGLCGPDEAAALIERVHQRDVDGGVDIEVGGVVALARQFEGAWPYLMFVATVLGIADPLDARVVRAYWLGSPTLERTAPADLARHLDDRFRRRAGRGFAHVAEAVAAGALPTHDCHVLAVGPWLGLLRGPTADVAVATLDSCRIRIGRVLEPEDGGTVGVVTTTLGTDGHGRLVETPGRATLRTTDDAGNRLVRRLVPDDHVAAHWDWACDVLDDDDVTRARASMVRALAVAR